MTIITESKRDGFIRSVEVLLNDMMFVHETLLMTLDISTDGHTSLSEEEKPDISCMVCSHINEVEYLWAEYSAGEF